MEKILAGLANKENVGILVSKSLLGMTFANDFIVETFGYSKDELLDFTYINYLMDPYDSEGNIEASMLVSHGEKSKAKLKPRFVRKDGTIFQADLALNNHKDSSGEMILLAKFENIVDTGDTVAENKDRNLARVAAKYNSGILLYTTAGLVYANKTAMTIFYNVLLQMQIMLRFVCSAQLGPYTH